MSARATYTYSNKLLASKTDAKGQVFTYFYDVLNRLQQIKVGGVVLRTFIYDTNTLDGSFTSYGTGRLVAVQNAPFTEVQSGIGIQFNEMYSYTIAGQPNKKRLQVNETPPSWATQTRNLDAAYTYDNEGKMTSVNYPTSYSFVYPNLVATAGPTYTYSFDSMSRPIGLTDQNSYAAVSNVQYGGTNAPPNALTSMNYFGVTETRAYNTLMQLTNVTVGSQLNMTYNYPAGANNGKISSQHDNISGETVTYAYDALNRLISASGSGWNQDLGYDGFGNLVYKTGANSPPLSIGVNPANNQVVGQGYDANGNATTYNGIQLLYDSENHVLSAVGLTDYLYDSQGKRIWKGTFSGGSLTAQEVYFYGVDGQKLGTYSLYLNYGTGQPLYLADPNTNLAVFFGGKRVAVNGVAFGQDRLGSNAQGKFFPYGEDRGTPIANDQVKFATYTRDSATGLDYADQRYYSNQFGRFMSPDPYKSGTGSGDPANPQTWNRYAYVLGDPVNFKDPRGLDAESAEGEEGPTDSPWPGVLNPFLPGGDKPDPEIKKWAKALAKLSNANDLLQRLAPDPNSPCGKDFEAIQTAYGKDLHDIQTQAEISNWNDAKDADTDLQRDLFTPGTKEYNFWASKGNFTISDYFRLNHSTKAEASLSISGLSGNIYFDANYVNGLSVQNAAALLTHELLHNLGIDDTQAQNALGLSTKEASDNITQKFLKDCFK